MTLALIVGVPELLIVLFIATIFAFWIWMLVDCARNPRLSSNQRVAWILVIVFLQTIGAIVYFFAARASEAVKSRRT
jgi:hypothetical protein